jgi:ComF family protein
MNPSDNLKKCAAFFADALMPGPHQCFICDEEELIGEDGLCDSCRAKLKTYPAPVCLQPLDGMTIGLQYGEEIAAAVLRFKKNGMTEYGPFLAQYLSVPKDWNADVLVPVPIHPLKLWLRHMQNHTETLAAYLSRSVGIPFSTKLLLKTKFTREQKKLKDPSLRRKNIRGSFTADPLVKGLRIVLVDDVFTTGATVYECSRVLKQKGASAVYLSVVASPPH